MVLNFSANGLFCFSHVNLIKLRFEEFSYVGFLQWYFMNCIADPILEYVVKNVAFNVLFHVII